ncbi:MAG: hypothetical protein LBR48_01715 [Dysgonamonadaceae bacterium]|jgi:hypothetical protein|nr:hypothetical protein [Dysgonamonadaceae bacterium]
MHGTVRNFKYNIVGSRFATPIAILVALAMRIGFFLVQGIPRPAFPDTGFVWKYLPSFFEIPEVSFVLSTLAVFVIVWILSLLNDRFSLIHNRSNLPFIIPLIFFSSHPYFLLFTPDYISLIFILCAFFPLLSSYQKYETQLYSFKSAVLIGIAGLFQVYALVLLPLFWKGEFSMRRFYFKSFLSSLLGVVLVYWCAFGVFYFFDGTEGFIAPFLSFAEISIFERPEISPSEWISVAVAALFFLTYMSLSFASYARSKVLTHITLQFIIFVLFILVFLQILYWEQTIFMSFPGIALLSFVIAYFYSTTVSKWAVRSFYFMTAVLAVFYLINYFPFLDFSY